VHLVFVISALLLALSDRWGGDHKSEQRMANGE
jgi:hypothetical protein